MSEINLVSVNCQGIGDRKKRSDVLDYYKKQNIHILCLQDTHISKEKEFYTDWGAGAYFTTFSSNSRGVAFQ